MGDKTIRKMAYFESYVDASYKVGWAGHKSLIGSMCERIELCVIHFLLF